MCCVGGGRGDHTYASPATSPPSLTYSACPLPACLLPACSQQLARVRGEVRAVVAAPQHCLPFLQPGRLVRVLPPADEPSGPQQQQERRQEGAAGAVAAEAAAAAAVVADSSGGVGDGVLAVVVNFERAGRGAGKGQQQQQKAEGAGGSEPAPGQEQQQQQQQQAVQPPQYIVDVLTTCSAESLRQQGGKR